MHVVATAGHVDHGKSTLVRALTGMEPDRFAEEKRRGMTIDLGYAWTRLSPIDLAGPGNGFDDGPGEDDGDARTVAFVDVPGHERFIATMLAGLGPAPAVMFVVAADEGWRRQSAEHLSAVDALGLTNGLLVVTRSDLAEPAGALEQAQREIARSSLGQVPWVSVSGRTGAGLPALRTALGRLVASAPVPAPVDRLRLWIDRSFTIRGAGTVVTGTLSGGALGVGDELQLGERRVRVRGLQSLGEPRTMVTAPARVAVNLRGVEVDEAGRGDALLSPASWPSVVALDARLAPRLGGSAAGSSSGVGTAPASDLPTEVMVHLGTATVGGRIRPLAGNVLRIGLDRPLPVEPGDRLVLRDPGRRSVLGGAVVLDVDPPELRRRGAARARAAALTELQSATPAVVLAAQVGRRGAVRRSELTRLGVGIGIGVDALGEVRSVGEWLVDPGQWRTWTTGLTAAVTEQSRRTPLDPRLGLDAAAHELGVPARELMPALAAAAGLSLADGRISLPGAESADLGPAEAGVRQLEQHLGEHPFLAPERPELDAWGLGQRELAAAERAGRIVRLSGDVVLLPTGPARAMRVLAELPQPFTLSTARAALGTTRRVAVPLLEHLDRRGWTVRDDGQLRRVRGR